MVSKKVDTTCLIANPLHVATQGVLDNSIGIATLGWIVRVLNEPVEGHAAIPPNNIGTLTTEPNRDWYIRRDSSQPWHGPLTYQQANYYARVETRDGTDVNVKYQQLGTFLGTRGGDPITTPEKVFVAYIYANGKQYLQGRAAEFHKDLLPA